MGIIDSSILLTAKTWLLGAGLSFLKTVLILVLGLIAVKLVTKLLRKILGKTALDISLIEFAASACRILLAVLVVITALCQLGIPTESIITALASAGVAVSLALKDSLGNLAGGIVILFSRPFGTGDVIEVDGVTASVHKIDYFHTVLDTVDGNQVVIPNGVLVTKTICNYTREPLRRADFPIGVSYDADLDAAKKALLRAAKSCDLILSDPAPEASVTSYGDSAVNITLRVWTESANFAALSFTFPESIKRELDAAGVEIPYNKVDIYIKEGAAK